MKTQQQIEKELDEKLWIEVMEDYVITAELGHLAKDQKAHKDEMRWHFGKLKSFIETLRSQTRADTLREVEEWAESKKRLPSGGLGRGGFGMARDNYFYNLAIQDLLSYLKKEIE